LFINLTPFIPLSTLEEGEEILERGLRPLLPYSLFKGVLEVKLIRAGGWEERELLKMGVGSGGWVTETTRGEV
jgi:hypothetical protein